MGKLNLYRKIRTALLATNKRTDSSIITECKIVEPLANDKGRDVVINDKFSKREYTRTRSSKYNRTTADRRK